MRARYGYKVEGGQPVPDPGELATIRLVKFLRERGTSYRAIGWELLKAGHNPRSGDRWHANQVRRMAQRV